MIKYFNLGSKEQTLKFLEKLPKTVEDKEIESLCVEYIEKSFLEKEL